MDEQTPPEQPVSNPTFSSGILEHRKHTHNVLIVIALVLFVVGAVAIYFTTKPYHIWFLGFVLIFSLFEANSFIQKTKKHLNFLNLWPVVLCSFSIGFLAGLGVLFLELKLLVKLAPVSILLFIFLNLILVFVTDMLHTFVAWEFVKKLLKFKVGDDYKDSTLLSGVISPVTHAITSSIRSLVFTLIILLVLAVLATFLITNSVLTQLQEFENIPEEDLQIPVSDIGGGIDGLTSVQEIKVIHGTWNSELAESRGVVLANKDKITGSLVHDTWSFLQGDLLEAISTAQQFASSINSRFQSVQSDINAIEYLMKHVDPPRTPRDPFYVSLDAVADLENDVDSQYKVFEDNKDKKFRIKLPLDSLQTDLGEIDMKKILTFSTDNDESVLGSMYVDMFQATNLYGSSQIVIESLKGVQTIEKERIDTLYSGLDTSESVQSKYIRLVLLLKHLVNYNYGYCESLPSQETSKCFKTAKLINPNYCDLLEESEVQDQCMGL